jgi:hypothetical protein
MDLNQAKLVMLTTHLSAMECSERALCVLMQSGPGIGKSSIVKQMCRDLAKIIKQPIGLVIEMLATVESPDVRGFTTIVPSLIEGELPTTVFAIPPWYPVKHNTWVFTPDNKIYAPGEWPGEIPDVGVLFIDELGQADDAVQKPACELQLNGGVGTTVLPLNWRVVAATNRVSDRSGVMRPLMLAVNRRMLLNVTGEVGPWVKWNDSLPEDQRCHEIIVTFVQQHPTIVFRDAVPEGDEPYMTARTAVMTDRTLKALRGTEDREQNKLPMTDLAREAVAGLIGEGAAAQLFTHMRFFNEIPALSEIVEKPKSAKIPTGKDGQMVACYMLSRRVTEENASPIITYVSRMADEMQILAAGVFNGNPACQKILLGTPEYQELLQKHKDILRASES